MKKLAIILTLIYGVSLNANAQTKEGETVVSLEAGYSIFAAVANTTIKTAGGTNVESSLTPVLMLSIDYGITDFFSLGVMGAYQNLGSDFSYTYQDVNLNDVTEDVRTDITRMNFSLKPNFHYGNGDELDLYSGLRIGLQTFGLTHNSTDDNISLADFSGSRLSVGVTALGVRYFFTDNIGINMEVGVGVPYAVAGGVSFRF